MALNGKFKPALTCLFRMHLIALVISVGNATVCDLTDYSLIDELEVGINITTLISGFILFFLHLKPFTKISYYFSLYAALSAVVIFGLIFRGMLGAMILSIALLPVIPDEQQYENKEFIISSPFQGFLGMCCPYQLKEKKLGIFEKEHEVFQVEGEIDFDSIVIEQSATTVEIIYSTSWDGNNRIMKAFRR